MRFRSHFPGQCLVISGCTHHGPVTPAEPHLDEGGDMVTPRVARQRAARHDDLDDTGPFDSVTRMNRSAVSARLPARAETPTTPVECKRLEDKVVVLRLGLARP